MPRQYPIPQLVILHRYIYVFSPTHQTHTVGNLLQQRPVSSVRTTNYRLEARKVTFYSKYIREDISKLSSKFFQVLVLQSSGGSR